MTLVVDKFRTLLPSRIKTSPSGWFSFNAPCCQHRGHKPDTRKRAGMRFDGDGIIYNCFNCKFTTGWQPGSLFGEKMKSLCRWLGASDDEIKELIFESLKTESLDDNSSTNFQPKLIFENKNLPEGSMSLLEWVDSEYWNEISVEIEPIISYIHGRGLDPFSGNFYWSPSAGYESRVIIPFLYEGRIVGNTARKITKGNPKYLSDQHPNFVFNLDNQYNDNKYCFVVEGPFDALSIDGVALLTNDISIQQAKLINDTQKEIIVVPDQDRAGLNIISQAAELGWSVSFPNWEDDIKDVADAINRYGKMFVIVDLLLTAERNAIKIDMAKRNLMRKLDLGENNV